MPEAPSNQVDRVHALRTIRGWIANGRLKPGDALPSERHLASNLKIGRNPLRWAVTQLDQEGLIQKVAPRTRIVVGRRQPEADAALLVGSVVLMAGENFAAGDSRLRSPGWNFQTIVGAMEALAAAGRTA